MRHLQHLYSTVENTLLNITSHFILVIYPWYWMAVVGVSVSLKSEVSEEVVLLSL